MQKIIHLTDTHLRGHSKTVLGLDPIQRMLVVMRSIAENHSDASCCVFTGDIADAGEVEAYQIAREALSILPMPVLLTLGNHDSRHTFLRIFHDAQTDSNGFVQVCHEDQNHNLFILDTLDEFHRGQGLLCSKRLAWLSDKLAERADRPAILFMHHPPLPVGLDWFNPMLMANGHELVTLLSSFPQVIHLAFGHVHVNTSGSWNRLSFSGSRGTCHKILANSAACSADYVDHGPAYDILMIGHNCVCVHNIEPAGPNRIIAREYATADQKGEFVLFSDRSVDRWM